jgi:glycerol-3-phosphate dehydrogenase (NAD(P)+)
MKRISVIGEGSFGTTLAWLISGNGHEVNLWCWSKKVYHFIRETRENLVFLKGVELPRSVEPTQDLAEALDGAELIFFVVPSVYAPDVVSKMASHVPKDVILVNCCKGFVGEGLKRMSSLVSETPGFKGVDYAAMSGPNLAREVSAGAPAATVIASSGERAFGEVTEVLGSETFRVYGGSDVAGVELGGALKNIYAIAAGVVDGLEFGSNARASLMNRALAEMIRLGSTFGARRETFYGLSGMGDLVCTCTSPLSRNHTVGRKLAKGKSLDRILGEMKMVAEGVETTRSVVAYARESGIEMPIAEGVHDLLFEGMDVREGLKRLMTRLPKMEN